MLIALAPLSSPLLVEPAPHDLEIAGLLLGGPGPRGWLGGPGTSEEHAAQKAAKDAYPTEVSFWVRDKPAANLHNRKEHALTLTSNPGRPRFHEQFSGEAKRAAAKMGWAIERTAEERDPVPWSRARPGAGRDSTWRASHKVYEITSVDDGGLARAAGLTKGAKLLHVYNPSRTHAATFDQTGPYAHGYTSLRDCEIEPSELHGGLLRGGDILIEYEPADSDAE